jgi:hypothetical protein
LRGHFNQLFPNNISIERKHADIVMLAVHLLLLVLPEARGRPQKGIRRIYHINSAPRIDHGR